MAAANRIPISVRISQEDADFIAELKIEGAENAQEADLKQYERELMWRIVRLTDSILQLAVTGKGAAYDDTVLQQLENTLKLAKIVQQADEV